MTANGAPVNIIHGSDCSDSHLEEAIALLRYCT